MRLCDYFSCKFLEKFSLSQVVPLLSLILFDLLLFVVWKIIFLIVNGTFTIIIEELQVVFISKLFPSFVFYDILFKLNTVVGSY